MKYYLIKFSYLWGGEGKEQQAQRENTLGEMRLTFLPEVNGVICNADQAIVMLRKGFCDQYNLQETIKELTLPEPPDRTTELLSILLDKVMKGSAEAFNTRCNQEQPSVSLMNVTETLLLENSCTDALQEHLSMGWRILAIQPQPDQRRPDYILGRSYLPTSAERR